VLSHAHVDMLLRDSARLQEEDAERANAGGWSRHRPALPLYDQDDVTKALRLLAPRAYRNEFEVAEGVRGRFRRAGHILGAATVELSFGAPPVRLVYSGDLGRPGRPILRDPEPVTRADGLLLESTYGDRTHSSDYVERLTRLVCETAERAGALLVPAFAVGRTQELVWTLRRLEDEKRSSSSRRRTTEPCACAPPLPRARPSPSRRSTSRAPGAASASWRTRSALAPGSRRRSRARTRPQATGRDRASVRERTCGSRESPR